MTQRARPQKISITGLNEAAIDTPTRALTEHNTSESLPSWGDFRNYIQENGASIIRVRFPDAPESIIDTIWCGVVVLEGERAEYLLNNGEWFVYGDAHA